MVCTLIVGEIAQLLYKIYIYIYIYIYFPAELRQSVLPFTVQVIKSATLKGLFHRAILTSNAARSPDSTAPSM